MGLESSLSSMLWFRTPVGPSSPISHVTTPDVLLHRLALLILCCEMFIIGPTFNRYIEVFLSGVESSYAVLFSMFFLIPDPFGLYCIADVYSC